MYDKPRLRPVEAFPVQQNGKTLLYLKDPLNLASPLGLSSAGYFILSHFDGRHSYVDIQEAFSKQFGSILASDELTKFVDMLDQHYYLQSERFRSYRDGVIDEFRRLPTRAAAHVGGAYRAERNGLFQQLDGYFMSPDGPGLPPAVDAHAAPRAVVAPHIDF